MEKNSHFNKKHLKLPPGSRNFTYVLMLAVINEEELSKEMSNKNLKQVNKIKIGACGYRQIGVGLVFKVNCCDRRIFSKQSNSRTVHNLYSNEVFF